jgi:hypothetical protein
MPLEQWASYWSKPAPMQAKPSPTEFNDTPGMQNHNLPNTGRLTIDEFVSQQEANKVSNMVGVLTANLISAADTYQVIASRDGERVVLSALLCQAQQRLQNTHVTRIDRMQLKTQQDRTQLQLVVLDIQPLACNAPPVTQLLDCLGPPRLECMTNHELAAEVHAARKLAP